MIQMKTRSQNKGPIKGLKIANGFYKDLYTKQNTDENIQRELLSPVNKSISPKDRAFCDDPISLMQLEIAMK